MSTCLLYSAWTMDAYIWICETQIQNIVQANNFFSCIFMGLLLRENMTLKFGKKKNKIIIIIMRTRKLEYDFAVFALNGLPEFKGLR